MNESKETMTDYVLEHRHQKDDQLRYDFMPALLDIIERPAKRWGKLMLWIIIAFVFVAIGWATFSKIDIVVVGQGQIVPDDRIQIAQAVESGVVKEINVIDGQFIERGDVLLRLEDQAIIEALHLKETMLASLTAEQAVIGVYQQNHRAQINTADYPAEHQAVVQRVVSENTFYQKQGAVQGAELTNAQYDALLRQRTVEIATQVEQLQAEIEQLKRAQAHTNITAPTTGYISGLAVTHVGQVVSSAEAIARVVPSESPLLFESYVSDRDIASVHVGMSAKIKLQAFPYSDYGIIEGEVIAISPAGLSTEGSGVQYIVKVALAQPLDETIPVTGLSGVVELVSGQRSVLEYFLDPVIEGLDRSLKEP